MYINNNNNTDLVFSYNVNTKMFEIFDKYQDYLNYKINPLVFENENKLLEMNIISLLESLDFSIGEVGTFLYSEMIVKIINMINSIKKTKESCKYNFNGSQVNKKISEYELDLINSLSKLDSQFYIDLSNKEMTLCTLHNYILKSIPKKYKKSNTFFGEDCVKEINYGYLAYEIALYIINNLHEQFYIEHNSIIIPNSDKKQLKLYL